MKLIVSLFYSSLIYFVVEIDNYFDKIKHVVNEFVITYNFVLKIVFEISLKHCYKCNIILFNKINIFLKSCYVIYCKCSLN